MLLLLVECQRFSQPSLDTFSSDVFEFDAGKWVCSRYLKQEETKKTECQENVSHEKLPFSKHLIAGFAAESLR